MARKVSLDKFAKGALAEIFSAELNRVTMNVLDVNTKATAKRKITLTLEFNPSEDRDLGKVTVKGESKLAARNSVSTTVTFGYDKATSNGECQELNAEMIGQMDIAEMERQWIAEQSDSVAVNFN